MYFHVRQSAAGQWTVVHVVGEIDLATAPRYRSELVGAATDAAALAVDLGECDLIDSVGLGITLGAARRMWNAGRPFAVVASGAVARTFAASRVDRIIDVRAEVSDLSEPARP